MDAQADQEDFLQGIEQGDLLGVPSPTREGPQGGGGASGRASGALNHLTVQQSAAAGSAGGGTVHTAPAPAPEARVGACHKCGAQVKDPSRVTICPTCGCRYHLFDCGARIQTAGVTNISDSDCPRCAKLCFCGGGTIMCHTSAQRQKRKMLASMSAEKRRRQYDAEVEAPAAPPRQQRAAAAAAAAVQHHVAAGASEDPDENPGGGRDRPAAHSERGQGAQAQKQPPQVKENGSANAQLFSLQTDMFIMKAKLARRERENLALQRLLQEAGAPGGAGGAPHGAGAASNGAGVGGAGSGLGPASFLGLLPGPTGSGGGREPQSTSNQRTSDTWTTSDARGAPFYDSHGGPGSSGQAAKRPSDPRVDQGVYTRERG